MKVIYGLGSHKLRRKTCIAVGVFDGVHIGHQRIISRAVSLAKKKGILSAVITFHPHPDSIIESKKYSPLLTSLEHRLNLIKSFGVNVCFVIKFDAKFRKISARNFISNLLVQHCRMKCLVMNKWFIFGKDREGNVELVSKLAKIYNFSLHLEKGVRRGGSIVSSTLIRSLIMQGSLKQAAQLLGRKVEVLGTVVGGDSRGRKLGFPTANIDPHHEIVPPQGVYLVRVELGSKNITGLVNIGYRPTFKKDEREIIELHLFDFKSNLYGKNLKVVFIKKLRNEKKFKRTENLIAQIERDIKKARQFFSK